MGNNSARVRLHQSNPSVNPHQSSRVKSPPPVDPTDSSKSPRSTGRLAPTVDPDQPILRRPPDSAFSGRQKGVKTSQKREKIAPKLAKNA